MNHQSNHNANTVRTLNNATSILSTKETKMNRRIVTLLFALSAALILSACAVESPFQGTGSVTVLPSEGGPMIVSETQISDRQQLAEYQAVLPSLASVAAAPKAAKASDVQINNRQQLAEYQANLTAASLVSTAPKTGKTNGIQINNRQQLAEYQASLPLYNANTTASVTTVQKINDRQALAEYQANLR